MRLPVKKFQDVFKEAKQDDSQLNHVVRGHLNASLDDKALLLLQTPKSNVAPLPRVSSREDLYKFQIGTRVFLRLSFKRNHSLLKKSAKTNEKIQFLTARGYLLEDERPTLLRINAYQEIDELFRRVNESYLASKPVSVSGVIEVYSNTYQLSDVRLHPNDDNSAVKIYGAHTGIPHYTIARLMPEYVSDNSILNAAKKILFKELSLQGDEDYRQLAQTLSLRYSDPILLIKEVHLGSVSSDGSGTADRAKHELEMLATSAIVNAVKEKSLERRPIDKIDVNLEWLRDGIVSMPINPTREQKKISVDILASFQEGVTTQHLVFGDVGFGKTCVISLIVYHLVKLGKIVVLLSPAEHLAIQTYDVLRKWYPDIQDAIHLVTHNTETTLSRNDRGGCYVGTSALLFRDSDEVKPFLICVDEEQRFGVLQRDYFKSQGAHYVSLTATPIPRTVAGTLLDQYQTHYLTKCFVEKSFIGELYMEECGRQAVFNKIKSSIAQDKQVLIICPLTTDSECEQFEDFHSVETLYKRLTNHFGNIWRFVHSKRDTDLNAQALDDVRFQRAKGLVASTAVEVGIDLPHLNHIVIFHPERFGLTQLHQLRGRIVRQGGVGTVSLYSPTYLTHEQIERLEYFLKESDGSRVAEFDAQRRGVGDLLGDGRKQSGKAQSTFIRHLTVNYNSLKHIYSAINKSNNGKLQ